MSKKIVEEEEIIRDEDGRLKGFMYSIKCRRDNKTLLEYFESETRGERILERIGQCKHLNVIWWTEYAKETYPTEFEEELAKSIYYVKVKSEIYLIVPQEGN